VKGEPREQGADEALRERLRNEPKEGRSAKKGWGKCRVSGQVWGECGTKVEGKTTLELKLQSPGTNRK